MNKTKKPIKFKESVHYSVKNRKAYKRNLILLFAALVVVLLGCGAMFYFGKVAWDPDAGFEPASKANLWWEILLVVLGAVIAIGSLVGFFFICYKSFKGFYATQQVYWKSAAFKETKAKALKVELFKLKKKDLKWYKKIGYINSDQFKHAMEEQKIWIKNCKQKKEKVNYAESKA